MSFADTWLKVVLDIILGVSVAATMAIVMAGVVCRIAIYTVGHVMRRWYKEWEKP